MNVENEKVRPAVLPWAVSIDEAAHLVGMEPRQFRRIFLESNRLQSVKYGTICRAIDIDELRAAYQKYLVESRQDH